MNIAVGTMIAVVVGGSHGLYVVIGSVSAIIIYWLISTATGI